MEWDNKIQSIFQCADEGLRALKQHHWLTGKEYDDIQDIISESIRRKQINSKPQVSPSLKELQQKAQLLDKLCSDEGFREKYMKEKSDNND